MNCENLESHVADDLRDRLPAAVKAELDAHLASCDRCSREMASLRRVWSLMEDLPGGSAGDSCRRRLDETIRGYQAGLEDASSQRGRPRARRLLHAAAAAVLLLVGVAAGFMMSSGGGGSPPGDRYLLLVYEPPAAGIELTAVEQSRRDEAYDEWYRELRDGARLIGWMRVEPGTGRSMQKSGDVEELLPIALRGSDEALKWVIVIRADSPEDAAAVARGCPALATGARVEIRPERGAGDEPGEDPA